MQEKEELIVEDGITYTVATTRLGIYWCLAGVKDAEGFEIYHRIKGPAINFFDGEVEWWYQDKYVDVKSQEEFEQWIKLRAF